jgi:hypothetical protein
MAYYLQRFSALVSIFKKSCFSPTGGWEYINGHHPCQAILFHRFRLRNSEQIDFKMIDTHLPSL